MLANNFHANPMGATILRDEHYGLHYDIMIANYLNNMLVM